MDRLLIEGLSSMFIRVGRTEIWIGRCGPWHRDVVPKVERESDPAYKAVWLWWMGREVVVS
jgi:hypothetical protein